MGEQNRSSLFAGTSSIKTHFDEMANSDEIFLMALIVMIQS